MTIIMIGMTIPADSLSTLYFYFKGKVLPMDKKIYTQPQVEVIRFDAEDVIVTSRAGELPFEPVN